MIYELSAFTAQLDPDFKEIGLKLREGLHLVLKVDKTLDGGFIVSENVESAVYSKKMKETLPLLQRCAQWTQAAWMIDTFKCLDAPYKAIHSASPYCVAFKRTALKDGEKYLEIEKDNQRGKNKKQLYERIDAYFEKALALLEPEEEREKQLALTLRDALRTPERLHRWLDQTDAYPEMKEADYILFFLDLPVDDYKKPHSRYLREKLFNTSEYNKDDAVGETWGTSNFFNTFNSKMPFLLHQSATFDITGRISATDARHLHEVKEILGRGIFPRPLPIFIFKDDLLRESIGIFKREALLDTDQRKGHDDIIRELYQNHRDDFGNYYLLYYTGGEVKDFDFVSKFRYELRDNGKPWQVQKLMRMGEEFSISDVFEFQNRLLPDILNNALVVKSKTGIVTKFFEDIEQKYCDNNNSVIYGLVLKYRKALYDFIYKSKQSALTGTAFRDILLSAIQSDVRRDENFSNTFRICHKLNIFFSLNHLFDSSNSNFNGINMPSSIPRLTEKMRLVANADAHFDSPEEFAFGAGQVIYYLLYQSRSENRTHALLEPFTQKTNPDLLKSEIARVFDRYKHDISFGKGRFEKLMREVLGYEGDLDLKKQFPVLLAGYFADPVIFEKKENTDTTSKL